jgi:hypothetical protein
MRPLKFFLRLGVLLGVAFLARAEGPSPEPRSALIIGNAAYSFAPLKNPINDAEAMAKALEGAGFKVIMETDADQAKMVEAIRTFGAELKKRGGVGLFYFSGTTSSASPGGSARTCSAAPGTSPARCWW